MNPWKTTEWSTCTSTIIMSLDFVESLLMLADVSLTTPSFSHCNRFEGGILRQMYLEFEGQKIPAGSCLRCDLLSANIDLFTHAISYA